MRKSEVVATAGIRDRIVKSHKEGLSISEISSRLAESRYTVKETLLREHLLVPNSLERLKDDEWDEIVRLYEEEEFTYHDLSEMTGIAISGIRDVLVYLGATTAKYRQRGEYTSDVKLRAIQLRANGETYASIAEKLGLSISTAHKFANLKETNPQEIAPKVTTSQVTKLATALLNLDVENLPLEAQEALIKMEGLLLKLEATSDSIPTRGVATMTQANITELLLNPEID